MTEPTPSAFYFAWVGAEETTFIESEHARFDEDVFDYRLQHEEGDFAILEVTIRNPRIGPLSPGRDTWCWFALGFDDIGVVPRVFARLRAVPADMHLEEVTFVFRARPPDYEDRKEAVAAAHRDAPYFDRVWLARERWDDPDAILDARPAAWHIDPVTHAVTISDFNVGEDGVVDLSGDDVLIDGLGMEPAQRPIRALEMVGEVDWRQAAVGSVDIAGELVKAFKEAGTGASYKISSYTGEGVQRDWPVEGRRIGAGWTVGESSLRRSDGIGNEEFLLSILGRYPLALLNTTSGAVAQLYGNPEFHFPLWHFWPVLNIGYAAERSFTERVTFTLTADVQATDTEADEQPPRHLEFASAHVGEPVDPGEVTPIGDLRRRSYFATDRGKVSLGWLISRGVAEIRLAARALEIGIETSLRTGLQFSLRKSARVVHDRLDVVGGEAAGKIIAFEEHGNSDAGTFWARAVIGCTIGQGNTVTEVAGTPDYVEEGYVEAGYQTYTGQVIMPISGAVTYNGFTVTPGDDGVDFFNMTPARILQPDSDGNFVTLSGGEDDQRAVLQAAFHVSKDAAEEALNQVHTHWCVHPVALNTGPFETTIPVVVSPVMVIKTADLEAGSSS